MAKRFFKPRKKTAKTKFVKQKTLQKQVVKIMDAQEEDKFQHAAVLNTTVGSASVLRVYLGIAQGTDVTQRIGNRIRTKYYACRNIITFNGSTASVREIIFQIKSDFTGFVNPILSDILLDIAQPVTSMYNHASVSTGMDNRSKPIRILSDKTINLDSNNIRKSWITRINWKRTISYLNATNALSAINGYGLFRILVSDVSLNVPILTSDETVVYTDI